MPEPSPPGEPGYNSDRWFQHIVNVGLRLARKVGTGLPLVNALRKRFVGVALDILGAAARILGQGIRAAQALQQGGSDYVVPLDSLPIAPAGFFGPEEVDRIVGLQDKPGVNTKTGAETYHENRVNWPEDWSKSAIEEAVNQQYEDENAEYVEREWQTERDQESHWIWIGKRY